GFAQSELDREVKGWRASYQDSLAKADTRQTPDLANQIASEFEGRGVFTHPKDDLGVFESYAPSLNAAAAQQALRDLVRGQGPVIFVSAGSPIQGGDAAIAKAYEKSVKVAVAPPKQKLAKAFPYAEFGKTGEV